ncbi:MAG: methionyl-tRNA formyltransferase, partial [Schleiferiaceae bacterium]|nr:methionyl-tRNA formyltransferase [Schleiferiaceae bacterium]
MTKVVFFGTPDFAIPALQGLIDAPHIQIQAIVTAQDKPAGRGRSIRSSAVSEAADRASIRCLKPELLTDPAFLDSLKDFNADLFVVIAFRKLPDILWQMP